MLLRFVLLAATFSAVAGCALLRPPLTPAERLAADAARLAEAPTDSARTAVALDLIRQAGLTPISGERFVYGTVVAGLVPGRTPISRDTLIVVATAIDGPQAAALLAASARLVETAARRGAEPGRSILVALWAPRRAPGQGLADVLAFPLWPREAIDRVLIVGGAPVENAGVRPVVETVTLGGATPSETADRLATRLLRAASAPLFSTPSDTLQLP